MKEELYMIPYFGVFPPFFKALNKAFSAPRIYIVEAAAFARLTKEPAWEINLAATLSPIKDERLGLTAVSLAWR